ncbi:zinc ribbon domain-containing protein [Paenibacillus sp. HB172176]|uniref:zinc ribbon domain-containing protein n=1 Tax=Paenibacillus sp. HB172176 TaxID=2493690 RepID=UPI00143AF515|nr:zinc ribbon domain-containing protein [Paenibacillus sp. HB172176]
MSLFDKLKDGAAKAADKAKDSVEVAKLSTQISGKKKEIEKIYRFIGESVYNARNEGTLDQTSELINFQSRLIDDLDQEIKQLEARVRSIKNERECICGKTIPADTKFCPHCGQS